MRGAPLFCPGGRLLYGGETGKQWGEMIRRCPNADPPPSTAAGTVRGSATIKAVNRFAWNGCKCASYSFQPTAEQQVEYIWDRHWQFVIILHRRQKLVALPQPFHGNWHHCSRSACYLRRRPLVVNSSTHPVHKGA